MTSGKCRECGQPAGPRDSRCPHCGVPDPVPPPVPGGGGRKRAWGYEWKSRIHVLGWPLVHVAVGRDERGRLRVARGIVAVGQFGIGLVTVAQLGIGFLFGFGQLIFGLTAVAQGAITLLFGVGQIAVGYVAIGQLALGVFALGQAALGAHIWTPDFRDPEAVEFFRGLCERAGLCSPSELEGWD